MKNDAEGVELSKSMVIDVHDMEQADHTTQIIEKSKSRAEQLAERGREARMRAKEKVTAVKSKASARTGGLFSKIGSFVKGVSAKIGERVSAGLKGTKEAASSAREKLSFAGDVAIGAVPAGIEAGVDAAKRAASATKEFVSSDWEQTKEDVTAMGRKTKEVTKKGAMATAKGAGIAAGAVAAVGVGAYEAGRHVVTEKVPEMWDATKEKAKSLWQRGVEAGGRLMDRISDARAQYNRQINEANFAEAKLRIEMHLERAKAKEEKAMEALLEASADRHVAESLAARRLQNLQERFSDVTPEKSAQDEGPIELSDADLEEYPFPSGDEMDEVEATLVDEEKPSIEVAA